ncbi:hypothetical protein V8E52_006686 [Russula decolorans]
MISRGSNPTESADPDVRMAYRSICQGGTLNWLALTYEKWSPGLRMSAAGSQGLSELKQSIANLEQSVIFVFCRLSVDGIDCFATITYIPETTSGLRRARTSMAARTVQSWFKRPQATLTVSRLDDLTVSAILDAMPTPPSAFIPPTAMVRSHSEAQGREKALPRAPEPVIRTASEPPATYVSLRGPPNFGDAHGRSMQREAARLAAEAEERAVQREEAVRQARIKEQRAAEAQQAEEEELARRAQLERDLVRKAAARAAREETEREEEEQREREREERRRQSAERRAEEMRRVEEWMREEERKREEFARAEEELKRSAIERREAARVAAAKRRRENRLDSGGVLLSGWVTVQHPESIAWRRRYFQLTDALLRLYHRQTDTVPSDVIVLKSTGPTINEWYEGFEELRSIPYAFALVFDNGEPPIMLFSDSAPEKDLLSGLLMTCP